jgi:hypothetical protein
VSATDGRGVLEFTKSQRQMVRNELERLNAQQAAHKRNREQVEASLEAAWNHLLELLVPNLAPAALDAAARRLSLPSISAAEVARRAQDRRTQIDAALAAVERDERFVARESRLNEIAIRSHELSDNIETLARGVQLLEAEPVFKQLIEANYGGPGYTRSWWQPSYYTFWKHADRIVEKHAARLGVTDFAGLRARYQNELEALRTLEAERNQLFAWGKEIEALVAQHGEARAAAVSLDDWSCSMARARAREHLAAVPEADGVRLFADDPALSLAIKRVYGVAAKVRYLDAMAEEWLGRSRQELQRSHDKLDRVIAKIGGSQKKLLARYDSDEIESKYGFRAQRWRERSTRYQEASQTIVVFNDYGAYPTLGDYLWWDLMTGGHYKGSFIPEVADYHARDHHHHHDDATAALAGNESHGSDSLTSMDAS